MYPKRLWILPIKLVKNDRTIFPYKATAISILIWILPIWPSFSSVGTSIEFFIYLIPALIASMLFLLSLSCKKSQNYFQAIELYSYSCYCAIALWIIESSLAYMSSENLDKYPIERSFLLSTHVVLFVTFFFYCSLEYLCLKNIEKSSKLNCNFRENISLINFSKYLISPIIILSIIIYDRIGGVVKLVKIVEQSFVIYTMISIIICLIYISLMPFRRKGR